MKQLGLVTAAAIGLMSAALSAHADVTLNYLGTGNFGTQVGLTVTTTPGGSTLLAQGNYFAGFEKININGGPTINSFCIDLGDFTQSSSQGNIVPLASAPDAWAGPMGATAASTIKKLWASYVSLTGLNASSDKNVEAAALQVAIWSAIDSAVGTYQVSFSGPANVLARAAVMLANPGSVEADLVAVTGGAQDFLVPVPEPTTMVAGALLLLPFGASALRIIRKKA